MQEKIGNVTLDYEYYPGEDLYSDGPVEEELLEIAKNYQEKELNQLIYERNSWPVLYHFSHIRQNILEWLPITKEQKVLEIGSAVDRSQEFSREKPKVSPVSICRKCAAPSMHIEIVNAIM